MNRIILIGNGFDLAHGMPTSYQNFLDDLWKTAIEKMLSTRDKDGDFFTVDKVPPYYKSDYTYKVFKEDCDTAGSQITFKNKFLEIITKKSSIQNWVDIENEYYELLKKAMEKSTSYSINDLNSDFERIKSLLKAYLTKCENEFKQTQRNNKLGQQVVRNSYSEIKVKELSRTSINNLVDKIYRDFREFKKLSPLEKEEFKSEFVNVFRDIRVGNNDIKELDIRKYFNSDYRKAKIEKVPSEVLFLNFNYTSTESLYSKLDSRTKFEHDLENVATSTIHIHGSLNEHDNNPIIFGYGDELDDDYKRIEKLNKNEYLENIKSIKYLETDNYKKLLEFIESDEYQVFIFGHSCGTSDRTLLNTLFEHDNCASIKPFYHKYKSKEDPEVYLDNYSDIVRNISRNFNDKIKMRDRVVNKTYCSPLID